NQARLFDRLVRWLGRAQVARGGSAQHRRPAAPWRRLGHVPVPVRDDRGRDPPRRPHAGSVERQQLPVLVRPHAGPAGQRRVHHDPSPAQDLATDRGLGASKVAVQNLPVSNEDEFRFPGTAAVAVVPQVTLCSRHGQAVAKRVTAKLESSPPPWGYVLLILGALPFIIVVLAMARSL